MANEYTPTVNASAQLAAAVSSVFAPPNKADIVLAPLCMSVDATGFPSLVVKIPQPTDMTAASAATYGTALSSNDALGFDTAASMTIVEAAATRGIILDTSVSIQLPGMGSVDQLMQEGSLQQKVAILGPELNRLMGANLEKFEADHCALTTSPSNSVGTSGVALSVADLFSARYTYDTLEPITRERALFLWPVQVRDLITDLATNGGGLGGSVWTQLDVSVIQQAQLPVNGYQGSFLGIPVYQGSHSLRTLSDTNANVNGMLFAVGRGDPFKPGAQYGYICNAVRKAQGGSLHAVRMINSPDDRGTKVSIVTEYNAIEFRDTLAVRIKTKAT
jgi:hypothetical protein